MYSSIRSSHPIASVLEIGSESAGSAIEGIAASHSVDATERPRIEHIVATQVEPRGRNQPLRGRPRSSQDARIKFERRARGSI